MNRSELVKKLELVGRALATNDAVPIMKNFCFDGQCVYAENGEQCIISPCETEATFMVHGQTLLGLLRASQSEEVTFSFDNADLMVQSGRSTFKLPSESTDKFLYKPPSVDKWDLSIPITGLEACLLTSSKDTTQSALMGVLVYGSLYSSDGDTLTRFHLSGIGNQLEPYMLPNAFCEHVLKLAQGGDDVISLAPGWAKAKLGQYTVVSQLMEPPKIDFEDVISKTIKGPSSFAPIPAGLDASLSRARVVADPEGKPTQLKVESSKNGSRLRLTTDTHLGIVKDVLPFNQHEVTALVSPQLMQRSIGLTKQMSIQENCCIFINDDASLYILLSNFG